MHSLLTLLLQIAVILVVARVVGLLFRKINQPQVVGEMVAGIILGPSLLGWVAPGISAQLFVPGSLEYLNVISQVGLILFMFLVGLELDPRLLNGNRKAAVAISQSSIIVPFVLGGLLAMYLYPRLSGPPVSLTAFTLFMCAAMSITAFPVLARILLERDMLRTKIGALAISCAAVDDVTAWCILAVVIAIVRSGQNTFPVWVTIGGTENGNGLNAFVNHLPAKLNINQCCAGGHLHRAVVTEQLFHCILDQGWIAFQFFELIGIAQ